MSLSVVVMAAGKGTRMKSRIPKVLHRLGGQPLLQHVLGTAEALAPQRLLVITGHQADEVEASLAGSPARCVRQQPQLGTGHAIQQVVPHLGEDGTVLILSGDVPLLSGATARALVEACGGQRLALLTVTLADPTGYGRILREDGAVRGIVEHKDATAAQRAIHEIYTGMMAAPAAALKRWVMALRHDNAQREYYLTDVVAMAVAEGLPVVATLAADEAEVAGVNSPLQLAQLERALQQRRAQALMSDGVRLADPARFDLRGTLECGSDVEIDVGCVFEGRVRLGERVRIGAHCVLRDCVVEDGAVLHPFTLVEGATVGAGALVGPYARLRPGTQLGPDVHVGNFVEIKNSNLGRGAKANHLAYLGDADVGERVNYGAGSITANYDGANKHRSTIGNDVHVGSNCVLVAPIVVGDGATIGGGSTVAKSVPAGQLTVARAKPTTLSGWKRPAKAPKPPAD